MSREIKFRAWDKKHKQWLKGFQYPYGHSGLWLNIEDGALTHIEESGDNDIVYTPHENIVLCQFTGLKDKNGVEIDEGDVLKVRKPYRTSQVHTGNNIPNGRYEEPLEPAISEEFEEVSFGSGCFVVGEPSLGNLLCWELMDWDASGAMEGFRSNATNWSGPEGELQYLLEEYGFSSEDELVKSLGVEVVGNIYEKGTK